MSMQKPVKTYDQRAERLLFDALKGKVRGRTELVKLTRADAVALTGMPSDQAETSYGASAGAAGERRTSG